jgi:hypothetical protein
VTTAADGTAQSSEVFCLRAVPEAAGGGDHCGPAGQGPGKVVHAVCSSLSVRCGSRAWWRLAAAMLAWPSMRSRLMARLPVD